MKADGPGPSGQDSRGFRCLSGRLADPQRSQERHEEEGTEEQAYGADADRVPLVQEVGVDVEIGGSGRGQVAQQRGSEGDEKRARDSGERARWCDSAAHGRRDAIQARGAGAIRFAAVEE